MSLPQWPILFHAYVAHVPCQWSRSKLSKSQVNLFPNFPLGNHGETGSRQIFTGGPWCTAVRLLELLSESASNIKFERNLHHRNGWKVFHEVFAFHVELAIFGHPFFAVGFLDLVPVKELTKASHLVVPLICHPVLPVVVWPLALPFKPAPRVSEFDQVDLIVILKNGVDSKDRVCMMTHKSQCLLFLSWCCARDNHHSLSLVSHPPKIVGDFCVCFELLPDGHPVPWATCEGHQKASIANRFTFSTTNHQGIGAMKLCQGFLQEHRPQLQMVPGVGTGRFAAFISRKDWINDDPRPTNIFWLGFWTLPADTNRITSWGRKCVWIDGLFNQLRPLGYGCNGWHHPTVANVSLHDVVWVNSFTKHFHIHIVLRSTPSVVFMKETRFLCDAIHIADLSQRLIDVVDNRWTISEVHIIWMLPICSSVKEKLLHALDFVTSETKSKSIVFSTYLVQTKTLEDHVAHLSQGCALDLCSLLFSSAEISRCLNMTSQLCSCRQHTVLHALGMFLFVDVGLNLRLVIVNGTIPFIQTQAVIWLVGLAPNPLT